PGAVLAQHVDWHRKRELVNTGVDGDHAMVGIKPENTGHAVSQDRPGGREVDELLNVPRSGIEGGDARERALGDFPYALRGPDPEPFLGILEEREQRVAFERGRHAHTLRDVV